MRRLCLLLAFALTACQITTPLPPASPTQGSPQATQTIVGNATSASVVAIAPTWTPQPTLTPSLEPTITHTPQPTLTAQPTITPTSRPVAEPVVLIARPVANEFVPGSITVAGKVANVTSGTVLVELRSPDGLSLGPPPVVAPTSVVTDGLAFVGEIPLELPPTPRPFTVHVGWSEDGQSLIAEASQPVNLLGRFPRIARLTISAPQPFTRGADPTIAVRGIAPGPPSKVLARLLDDNDQVLESVEAQLRWYQPGLPCDFDAALSNNPSATQVQVIMLGPDDAVIETTRIRLTPRG